MSKPTIEDQLRTIVRDSGLSNYEICKRSGIDNAAMSRFMHGTRGLSTASLNKLADVLEIKIISARKPTKRKGR